MCCFYPAFFSQVENSIYRSGVEKNWGWGGEGLPAHNTNNNICTMFGRMS